MRDVHYDAAFTRDFNEASKQWTWATWHQERKARDATVRRLLKQVFESQPDDEPETHPGDK